MREGEDSGRNENPKLINIVHLFIQNGQYMLAYKTQEWKQIYMEMKWGSEEMYDPVYFCEWEVKEP